MRVDLRTHGTEPAEQSTTERARAGAASGSFGTDSAPLDQARFSFDQARVQDLESQVLAQPEVRQEKVDSLRESIGHGEYSVSDSQIADAMFADFSNGNYAHLAW